MIRPIFIALFLLISLNIIFAVEQKSDREFLIEELIKLDSIMDQKYDLIIFTLESEIQEYDTLSYSEKINRFIIDEQKWIRSYGRKNLNEMISGYYQKELKEEIIQDQENFIQKRKKLGNLNNSLNLTGSMRALVSLQTRVQYTKLRINELNLFYELFLKTY